MSSSSANTELPVNMAADNWNTVSRNVELGFSPGDFFYFQPYIYGQYTNNLEGSGNLNPYPELNVDVKNLTIKTIDMSCNEKDLSMAIIDSSFCFPYDPSFVTNWSLDNILEIQQCFRSQTCANSILSNNLSKLESSKDSNKSRYEDLEDIYFYDCMNIFNICIAICVFICIIIYKSLHNE
jgi:hypothetical protein